MPLTGVASAGKLPSKAASRGPESSTAKLLAAVIQPVAAIPPSGKKTLLFGGLAAVVLVVIAVVATLLLKTPHVDEDKRAQDATEARRRQYEEFSRRESKPDAPAAAPSTSAKPSPAATPARPAGTPEYRPLPPATPPPPAPPPVAPPPPVAAPAEGSSVAISPETIARLRSEVFELHPFYMNLVLTPAEKTRLNGVLASGRGTPDDVALLEGVLGGPKLKAARDERVIIAQYLPTLERESSDNLPVDRITYTETGRVLNCRILEEGEEVVKVSRMLAGGVGGQLPIRREAIRIEKGKGVGTEFAARWETVRKGPAAAQVELLGWCKDNTLPGQVRLVAFTILRSDPSHTLARSEAGLPPDPVRNAEELAKGGLITYQGKTWNPKQLRDKFVADGFYLLNGSWYSKKDKMISVPGLFAYERQKDKPVLISGSLCHETETTYKKVADTEQAEVKFLRRFYAPELKIQLSPTIPPTIVAPNNTYELETRILVDVGIPVAGTKMQGDVNINVPVGALILEASVITTAEVKAGGSITVSLVGATGSIEPGKKTKLYVCDPKEKESHVIPAELVRGTTEVNLVAEIEQIAAYNPRLEKRHVRAAVYRNGAKGVIQSPALDVQHHQLIPDYKAILFPSNSNTIEAFRLKVGIAEPAPQIDRVFAANPEALK
jgi:hypothetical protein